MVDVILDTEDIRVLGGPARVDLELDFGKQGNRGSEIYAGYGKPIPENLPTGFQLKDLYINIDPSDDEYSCIYQYVTTVVDDSAINEWELLLRLSPAQRSINTSLDFTAGVATYSFPIENYFPDDVLAQITADVINVQVSFRGANPVAYSISNIGITTIQNPPNTLLDIEFTAVEFNTGSWADLDGIYDVQLSISFGVDETGS